MVRFCPEKRRPRYVRGLAGSPEGYGAMRAGFGVMAREQKPALATMGFRKPQRRK
jgi:hypothetical protein